MKINEVLENMPNLLESEKKMNSLFSDFYTNDKARINRMMLAYKEGIFQSILNEKNTEFDKNSIINRMVSFHDMREDKAKEAVNDWYLIIDNKVISAYKKYQKEKELKNQVENDIACKRNEKSNLISDACRHSTRVGGCRQGVPLFACHRQRCACGIRLG